MGHRALIGVEDADATYRARTVHQDGCPSVIIPVLTALVHDRHQGDVPAAVAYLMRNDWRGLYRLPPAAGQAAELIELPAGYDDRVSTGQLAVVDAGDHEWAYLFSHDRLRVYLGVPTEVGPPRWELWSDWPVSDLPGLRMEDVLDVQQRGFSRRWTAVEARQYLDLVRERFGEAKA